MTKLDYAQVLYKADGTTPHTDDFGQPLTVGAAIVKACSVPAPGDDQLGPMGKFAIGEIGFLVQKGLDITKEQVTKVKERGLLVFVLPDLVYVFSNTLDAAIADKE